MSKAEFLKDLIKDIDLFISQHAIYINKLEKALKKGTPFEPTDCHSCQLGKLWDEEIAPNKDKLSGKIRDLIEDIEKKHCQFHQISQNILNLSGEEQEKILEEIKKLSNDLFVKLLTLKNHL